MIEESARKGTAFAVFEAKRRDHLAPGQGTIEPPLQPLGTRRPRRLKPEAAYFVHVRHQNSFAQTQET